MTETGSAFAPDAYGVRYGGRAVLRAGGCVLGALAIIGFVITAHKPVISIVIALILAALLLGWAVVDLRKVARREVVFAVSLGNKQTARPGNGPAAQPIPPRSAQYLIDAGRPELMGPTGRSGTRTAGRPAGEPTTLRWQRRSRALPRVCKWSTARVIRCRSPEPTPSWPAKQGGQPAAEVRMGWVGLALAAGRMRGVGG